ncbi:MAG: hypothetical protein K5857_11010 [Lachnospiraceae bacterium]|nr:hypothetical protein [Lachnospiraceae bacterium]
MKRKNKAAVFVFIVIVLILVLIQCVISYRRFIENYHGISLKNASCRIPIRMWNPDEDEIYISENMYSIIDKDGQYIVFGCQLERITSEDEKHTPFPIVFNPEFLDYNSTYKLGKLFNENTDILQEVEVSGEDSRYSYNRYYISGRPKEEYEGYETYIVAKNEGDVRFVQAVLYKESMALSEDEKHEIFSSCNCRAGL